jgi:class 3 adenylate cyclase
MNKLSLAAKLIIFIGLATAIIFVAAFAYNYWASRQTVMAEVDNNARNLTMATAHEIEVILRGVEKVPLNLAAMLEVQRYSSQELTRLIQSALVHNREIFGIAIAYEPYAFDSGYYYYAPYGFWENNKIKIDYLGSETYRYFYLDWYQIPRELNRPQWSSPYFDEGGGNIIMATYSLPFYQNNGSEKKLTGVVTADIRLMWLKQLVSHVKVYETGYAFLISQNGDFVTHPVDDLIRKESIFSVAEARNDPGLRRVGREMVRGSAGFVPVNDFVDGRRSFLCYAPIGSSGWSLGVIFPETELLAEVRALTHKLFAIGLAGLILLCVMVVFLARSITRPLRTLAETTSALGHGDFAVQVPEAGAREIAKLAQSFNQLGGQLTEYMEKRDFIRDTFGRYVTAEVVRKLMESANGLELGGENRELTILMSDLRGFTALTNDMEPERVITFLNRYLSKMIEILMEHRAVIDEIIGDGILAFFGAPEPMEDHPLKAVSCALQMQLAMSEINALNEADGFGHLEMGIAVNSGNVVVGNIGSERRTKYGVVGALVNFTGRMESYTVGGQVLVSPSTCSRLTGIIELGDRFEVQMKGVPEPVTLYEVQGLGEPHNIRLPEKSGILTALPRRLAVNLYHIRDKIVSGSAENAWITDLSLSAANIACVGSVLAWQDVRLHLKDDQGQEAQGEIFAKVVSVKTGADGGTEALLRFTSVSPEIYKVIRRTVGHLDLNLNSRG